MFEKISTKKRNSIEVSLKFMSNFMDDKNEVVFVDRDKLQSGKKQCAVMHNNFVNKTLNYASAKLTTD